MTARTRIAMLVVLALVAAACSKTSSSGAATAPSSAEAANPASASDGAVVYINNCSSCHQRDGRGVPGAFPPLADNPLVTGNPIAVIAIVKHGLSGRIVVRGQAYSGIMPPWARLISDSDIAAVVTYIRGAFGNTAGAVTLNDARSVK
jgi:mono/diheme cytochrome c family protein